MANQYLPPSTEYPRRRRASTIVVDYPADAPTFITWREQDQCLLADGSFTFDPKGCFVSEITEDMLAADIPLLDLDTGEVKGVMNGAELFAAFASFYVYCAVKRDEAQAAAAQAAQELADAQADAQAAAAAAEADATGASTTS